jgi:glycolate oxidase iron-sulfur subunit
VSAHEVAAPGPGRGLFPDDLLRTCISCGFCLSACPTYQDTRNEASSPRGRINLMRALEAGTLQEDDVREEFSFCLGCRACEPVCPAGVKYGALLEHARDAVGPARDPKLRGMLLAVERPWRTRLVGRILRMSQLLGLPRIAPTRALRATGKAAPLVASPSALRVRRVVGPENGEPSSLFLGCVGHLMFSGAAHAACGTLASGGYRVTTPPEQGCCGALHAHNGDLDGARELADWTVRSFAGTTGPIVTTAGGCGAFMADYGALLGTPEAEDFGSRVRDYSTLLAGREPPEGGGGETAPIRVAYQDSCHLRNGQKVTLEPRALLASLPGVEVVDLPSAGRCCGAAGTYALMRPDDSLRFLDVKLAEIAEAGVDAIVSGNPGCLLQFRQGVQRRADLEGVRVLHTAELVAERLPQ